MKRSTRCISPPLMIVPNVGHLYSKRRGGVNRLSGDQKAVAGWPLEILVVRL
jgi:hypothetical protein